ncbi:MAG: glycine--tRNA ligase [Planctomycetota bacterium]
MMDTLISLCKHRGFIYQSSEIYGGLNSCWDYGPLGSELLRNIKDAWWLAMSRFRDDIEGIDASIMMAPKTWEASGHVSNFSDPLVDCKKCRKRFRADHIQVAGKCPEKKCGGDLTDVRQFNLMFKTHMGPVEDEGALVYLRPETAQGIFVNFLNVQGSMRRKLPFGICQIGKSFRNEITPGNFIFRTREFEQMEMQFFIKPGTQKQWFPYWKQVRMSWHKQYVRHSDKLSFKPHGPQELAHYADMAEDITYPFPFSDKPEEIEGIHSRTDFDLKQHQTFSGKNLSYFDETDRSRYLPYVVETAVGAGRCLLMVLVDAYEEEQLEKDTRNVFKFHPALAPIKAAILPLVKKEGMPEKAQEIAKEWCQAFKVDYDESAAIGRRYRRQDEIGTPFCVTVDGDTLKDGTVTVRDRDSMKQDRLSVKEAFALITERIRHRPLPEIQATA